MSDTAQRQELPLQILESTNKTLRLEELSLKISRPPRATAATMSVARQVPEFVFAPTATRFPPPSQSWDEWPTPPRFLLWREFQLQWRTTPLQHELKPILAADVQD